VRASKDELLVETAAVRNLFAELGYKHGQLTEARRPHVIVSHRRIIAHRLEDDEAPAEPGLRPRQTDSCGVLVGKALAPSERGSS
jgi:hypothetical protein